MIIARYLFRELATTLVGVALLLSLIILSGTFVRVLAEAAEGTYPQQIVFTLFALKSIPNLAVVLPLAFMLAVLLALGRLYKDSEMVVLAACGVGPEREIRVVATLSILLGAIVGLFTLWLVPYTQDASQRLLDEAAARNQIEGIAPGRFNVAGTGEGLVYAEEISADRRQLSGLFGYARDAQGVPTVVTANTAVQHWDRDNGERYMVLQNGWRYEGVPGTAEFRVVRFEDHGLRIQEREVVPSKRALHSVSTATLWKNRRYPSSRAELQWRISLALSTMLLGLMAIPLAKTNPRQGRYGRLFVGILVYVIYNNLMSISRTWVAKSVVPAWLGMWWVHVLMLVVVLVLLDRHGRMPGDWRLPWRRKAA